MIKILVVDDEIDVCDFVKHFFEERNFKVFTALNGNDAMRLVKKDKPQLVLLDFRMKGIDGIETLKKIREVDKEVKVIMVTAVSEQNKIDEARELGASNYITKPLILEELEAAVIENTKEVNNV